MLSQRVKWAIGVVGLLALAAWFLNPYMWVATLAYMSLCVGLRFRKTLQVHVRCMSFGMVLDLGLVLLLEIQRDAIATAASFSLSPLQQAHILVSTLAVVFYFPTFGLGLYGFKKGWKSARQKQWHKRWGIAAFVFRTLGFLFMFSLLAKASS